MEINMANTIPDRNEALVLQAFDTLFNMRDYKAAVIWQPQTRPLASFSAGDLEDEDVLSLIAQLVSDRADGADRKLFPV
jgi:hypothetical protein